MPELPVLLWHWGRRGGGPRYTYELARALKDVDGIQVHLSLSRQSEWFGSARELGLPGCHINTYRGAASAVWRTPTAFLQGRRIGHYCRENGIRVVNCTMGHLWNAAAIGPIRRAGARYALTLHDAEPHPGDDNWLRRRLVDWEICRADRVVTLSEHVRQLLAQHHGYPEAKTDVIPIGVFPVGGPDVRPRQLPSDRPPRVGFVGRVLPYKGLPLLLDALKQLRDAGLSFEFLLAGQGDIRCYRDDLRELRAEVVNRWISEDEIAEIMGRNDVLVLPYIEASQSGVLATCYSLAVPAVVTPVGGLTEQVRDRETGIIAQDVSSQSIAVAIRRIIEDAGMYRRCSKGALEMALADPMWQRIATRYAELYWDVAATCAPPTACAVRGHVSLGRRRSRPLQNLIGSNDAGQA